MFGEVKGVTWISKILLWRDRENNIRNCFVNENITFEYPNSNEEFDDLLEHFQREKSTCIENCLGENIKLDRLIVMDDVSGLAERSDTFGNFLTVSRKFGISCVYIFHTIYPTRQNWQMILAQTKIFNIFPGSIQASSRDKILSPFGSRYKYNYTPNRNLCINRLYYYILDSSEKQSLIIDTRDVNDLGPAKFRTWADSNQ